MLGQHSMIAEQITKLSRLKFPSRNLARYAAKDTAFRTEHLLACLARSDAVSGN